MYKKYKVQVHVYDRYTQSTHLWAGVGRGFSPPLLCPPELSSEQQENCHFYPPSLFPPSPSLSLPPLTIISINVATFATFPQNSTTISSSFLPVSHIAIISICTQNTSSQFHV